MEIFLIVLVIVVYIFIGVLCYWTSILIDYKKSKTKQSLSCWLVSEDDISADGLFFDIRKHSYFCFSMFWIVTLPLYIVAKLFYYIVYLFSNIIKKILKIDKLEKIN